MVHSFLGGVRVLDLSQYVPGPYAGLLLADMGAEVVKLEPPGGDPMRRLLLADGDGVSPLYKVVNGGKTVIELDLKTEAGAARFAALAGRADILIESYRPGVLDRLGFTRERLETLNPRLVHCALSGWGQTGPYRLKAGHDLNYMALGGALIASGTRDRPVMSWPPVADYASGIQAAATALGALVARGRSGKGAFIDLSLAETVLAWQSGGLTLAHRAGPPGSGALHAELAPARAANLLNGGAACYNIYRTQDGQFVSLGNLEEKFWANFCRAVDRPDWIARQWESFPQEALIGELGALFAAAPLSHWERLLAEVDSCFEPVRDLRALADHPQIAARRLLQREVDGGPLLQVLYPAWVDGAPPRPRPAVQFVDAGAILARWQG